MKPAGQSDQPDAPVPLLISGGFFPLPAPMPLSRVSQFFRQRGRTVVVVRHDLPSMSDVRLRADLLTTTAYRLLDQTGADRLDILAFSMDGLSALYAIQHFGLDRLVRNLVCYGAPFRGTPLSLPFVATIYYAVAASQMFPGSTLLGQLLRDGLPPGPRYVSIGGTKDYVCPASCTRLPGAENHLVPYGHADFLHDRSLYRRLAIYLDR